MTPACGAAKVVTGRKAPLVCNLPAGHLGPHGIAFAGPPYVTWRTDQRSRSLSAQKVLR